MTRATRILVCLAGVVGVVVMVPFVDGSRATYGGADLRLLALEVAAALALLLVAGLSRPGASAVLVAVTGALWLLPEIAGVAGLPLSLRTVADGLGPLITALLLLALVGRSARRHRHSRWPLLIASVGSVLAAAARVVLVDPFYESDCWRTCEHNPLLLVRTSIGPSVELAGLVALAVGVTWSGALLLSRRPRGPGRVIAPDTAGWLVVVGLSGLLLTRSDQPSVPAEHGAAVALFVVVQAAALTWLALLGRDRWRAWRLEARLAHLVDLLGRRSDPEALVDMLRDAINDPGLRLAYWAPARETYVDTSGRPTRSATPGPGESVTSITRRGLTVAAVVHSRRVDGQQLERALTPTLRLALHNTQLRAASLAELDELTRSRTRVVERAQLERRRLERNLHDGAQQRAVSLALLVRIFSAEASLDDHAAVERAEMLTRTLVEELRRVARGIYPAVLADAGLVGGVVDLAERSEDVPVVVGDFPEARYAGTIETTAYLAVRHGIAEARSGGATVVTVTGTDVDGSLRVSVEDDAARSPYAITTELADQVGALGGTLVMNGAPGRRRVEVVLPCAS